MGIYKKSSTPLLCPLCLCGYLISPLCIFVVKYISAKISVY